MEMNRRQFTQAAVAGVAVAGTLGAVPAAFADEAPAAAPFVKTPNDTQYKTMEVPTDGKYVARAMGHTDMIFVETVMADGAIASCRVLRNDETRGIGSWACDRYPAMIAAAQNLDIDVMSGATFTCLGIKDAIEQCIIHAGGDPAAFHKGTPAPPPAEAHAADVDAVVVGAGTAGLITAVRLMEKGLNVLVFEQNSIPGGSMPMTYSGVAAAESELQKNYGLGLYEESFSYKIDLLLGFLKDRFQLEGDMPYNRALYENSGKVVDWMHSIGVGFHTMGVSPVYDITPYLAPGCYAGGSGQAMEFMVDRMGKLGYSIVLDTAVTELVQDEAGTVIGVKALAKDGSTWDVTAKAVCLASGGFGANHEMIAEYYPEYANVIWNCGSGSTGEGLLMAQSAGAALECMGREGGTVLSTTLQAGTMMGIGFVPTVAPGFMVNNQGKRYAGGADKGILNPENGGRFFYITDESGANCLMKAPYYDFELYRALFSRGDAQHFDSVEAAAEALNLPELPAELEKHNTFARAGEADEFGNKRLPVLDAHDGIWAIACMGTPYHTTGGIAIDTECHVLRDDRTAIPGLYAAGDVCGSIEEKDGKPYGMGFAASLSYGYIMAETVEAELA